MATWKFARSAGFCFGYDSPGFLQIATEVVVLLELDAGFEGETKGKTTCLEYSAVNAPRGWAALDPSRLDMS